VTKRGILLVLRKGRDVKVEHRYMMLGVGFWRLENKVVETGEAAVLPDGGELAVASLDGGEQDIRERGMLGNHTKQP
jgi:hypothetical protein